MKPEAQLQKDIKSLLTQVGFSVWDTSQGYRKERGGTRTSAGIPDLIVAGQNEAFFVELKVGKNPLTPAQDDFRRRWTINGGTSLVWRNVDDAWSWLVERGHVVESVR